MVVQGHWGDPSFNIYVQFYTQVKNDIHPHFHRCIGWGLKQQISIWDPSVWMFRKLVNSEWIWEDWKDDWPAAMWRLPLLMLLHCSGIFLFIYFSFTGHYTMIFMSIYEAEIVSDVHVSQVPNWTSWDASLRISPQWFIGIIAWTSVVREVIGIAGRLCRSLFHRWGILCS